jgi:hypothetical protein
MSKITIFRTSEKINSMRDYDIYVDNQKVNTISNGGIETLEISSGNHEIYIKIDWCKSRKIDINLAKEEELQLKCGSTIRGIKKAFILLYLFFPFYIHYLRYPLILESIP